MIKFTPLRGLAVIIIAPSIVIGLVLWHSQRKDTGGYRLPEQVPVAEMSFKDQLRYDPALVEQKAIEAPAIEAPSDDYESPLDDPLETNRMPVSELAQPDHEQILRTASQYDSLRNPAVRDPNSPENKALALSLISTRQARNAADPE